MSLPIKFVQDLWVRKTFVAAGHTLLVHDYFLTLNDEISYIWNSPWTVVEVLFLVNRYGNLIGQTCIRLEEAGFFAHNSQSSCSIFSLFTSYFTLLSSASVHVVLMRAGAIWGIRKHISQILVMCYMGYVLILMGGATYGITTDKSPRYLYLDLIKICVGTLPRDYLWLTQVGSFILDTILFVSTMRSLQTYSREFQCLYQSRLLRILIRDALMFFTVNIFGDSLNIASLSVYSNDPKYFLAKAFSNPLLSVVGQRLVLNLKSLKKQTYATVDLSRDMDRQLEAFIDADSIELHDMSMSDPERGQRSGNPSRS